MFMLSFYTRGMAFVDMAFLRKTDLAGSVNRSLKSIGRRLGLDIPLTMYVARHSWASAARSRNIPLPVISEGMGHGSDRTTRIYLASLDNTVIDEANRTIIGSL